MRKPSCNFSFSRNEQKKLFFCLFFFYYNSHVISFLYYTNNNLYNQTKQAFPLFSFSFSLVCLLNNHQTETEKGKSLVFPPPLFFSHLYFFSLFCFPKKNKLLQLGSKQNLGKNTLKKI